jgi:hypothetical protein
MYGFFIYFTSKNFVFFVIGFPFFLRWKETPQYIFGFWMSDFGNTPSEIRHHKSETPPP